MRWGRNKTAFDFKFLSQNLKGAYRGCRYEYEHSDR